MFRSHKKFLPMITLYMLIFCHQFITPYVKTSSSGLTERPHDAFCLSSQLQQYNTSSGIILLVVAASDSPLHTIKFCSVVFSVTLKLLVINTSSYLPRTTNDVLQAMSVTNQPCSRTDNTLLYTRIGERPREWTRGQHRIKKVPRTNSALGEGKL